MAETGDSLAGKPNFQPGGTPGGAGSFFAGLIMMALGVYLVFDRVTVHTSFWRFWGGPGTSFGITLLLLLTGVGLLTLNGRSVFGWLLAIGGVAIILAGILMNLEPGSIRPWPAAPHRTSGRSTMNHPHSGAD